VLSSRKASSRVDDISHTGEMVSERGPGRPREPETDARILDAALQLMAEQGYARMSMEQVAQLAGVTKPTIYRRYASKIQLAMAAIVAYCKNVPINVTGHTRTDLIAQVNQLRQALDRPYGMGMVGSVLSEERHTPELLASFREQLVAPRRQAIRSILEHACERGELRPEAQISMAATLLVGAYYAHYLGGTPFPDGWTEQVVDMVLAALVAASDQQG
jgi:AcrR family transcriptional regulator